MNVSASTLERRIKSGEVLIEIEQDGGRRRVWVLADDNQGEQPPGIQSGTSYDNQVAILSVQLKAALDLAEYRGELLRERDKLVQEMLTTVNRLSAALPAPAPVEKDRRAWWPWRRKNGGQ